MSQFCHLHTHDFMSLLDGLASPEDYVKRAKEMGHTHLAITNHSNIDSLLRFQKSCKENNIIPVFGMEAYLVPDISLKEKGEKRAHVTLLVKSEEGWKNLLKLVTIRCN